MNMKLFSTYFRSYLSGLASVVALLPVALTSFSTFPFPRGSFVSVFGYMCTVANYLIIGMTVFYLDSLRRYIEQPEKAPLKASHTASLVRATPIIILTLFIISGIFYIISNEKFREEIFVADRFVLNWNSAACLVALTIMFVGPVVALSLMGAKDAVASDSVVVGQLTTTKSGSPTASSATSNAPPRPSEPSSGSPRSG